MEIEPCAKCGSLLHHEDDGFCDREGDIRGPVPVLDPKQPLDTAKLDEVEALIDAMPEGKK